MRCFWLSSQASPSCKHSCCPRIQLDWGFLRQDIYGYKQPKEMCLSIPYKLNLRLQGREEVCLSLRNNMKISSPPSPFLQGITTPWPTPFHAYSQPNYSLFQSTLFSLLQHKPWSCQSKTTPFWGRGQGWVAGQLSWLVVLTPRRLQV